MKSKPIANTASRLAARIAAAWIGITALATEAKAGLILSDQFSVSGSSTDPNFQIGNGRQQGTAAPSGYTNVTIPSPNGTQLGNASTRVGQTGGGPNKDYLLLAYGNSLQNNLPIDASLAAGKPVRISFQLYSGSHVQMDKWIAHVLPNPNPATANWVSFTLAGAGQTWPVASAGQFGFLVRQNGQAEFFNNGQSYFSTPLNHVYRAHWTLTFTDPSGTGSPFTGAGTRVIAMNGGAIVTDTVLASGFGTSGNLRLGFRAYTGVIGGVDNLRVSTVDPVPAGVTYNLVARHSGHYLDASGAGTANGTAIIQSAAHGGVNQQWTLHSLGNGEYRLVGVGSGRCIEIPGASTSDGAAVKLYDWQNAAHQKFTLQSEGDGYFRLIFVHSGKALTVNNGSTTSGAAVVQNADLGASHSQWKFVKAPPGYLFCADEGGSKTFNQKTDIAYGADGSFTYVNGVDGNWKFDVRHLGDPNPEAVKSAFYKIPVAGGPAGYTRCASEGGTFTFSQPVDVAYGANGSFNYLTNVTGTVTFNNATFGDPIPNTVKAGYFKVRTPAPPSPPPLSQANLNDFVANRALYEGSSAAAYTPEFTEFLRLLGGDVYYEKLFSVNFPNCMLYITSAYNGAAVSSGGITQYNKNLWDNGTFEGRVAVLTHEFVHHIDNGSILAPYGYHITPYYQEEQGDSAKQWDGYAMTSPAEFIACGFQWITQDQGGTARNTIYAKHPSYYLFMINDYIPGSYQYQE